MERLDSFGSGSRSLRTDSYGSIGNNSLIWQGEQAPTQFLDANMNAFEEGKNNRSNSRIGSHRSIMSTLTSPSYNTIRFQVLIWSIGSPDVKTGRVSIKFRVTLFWNDDDKAQGDDQNKTNMNVVPNGPDAANANTKKAKGPTIWVMSGRRRAYEKNLSDTLSTTSNNNNSSTNSTRVVDIPPVSILNSDSFETIGQPEIMLLKEDTRLMRWSCMYRAQLHQEDMSVREFPHDSHRLCIKLGILSHRNPGGLWDRTKWKLALANESDTQRTIKVPHGLIVDNVRIPGFHYNKDTELEFDLIPLSHGSSVPKRKSKRRNRNGITQTTRSEVTTNPHEADYFLRTSIKVSRDSGYYDSNIMPLLGMLNIVAISILSLDATNFFKRALLALNIAFVEIGLRMTLDSKLPHVGYIIKMQKVLNWFFFSILWQMLESAILKFLFEYGYCSLATTRHVDVVVVILLLANQVYLTLYYAKKDDLFEFENNSGDYV
jgi:hypothetical protein